MQNTPTRDTPVLRQLRLQTLIVTVAAYPGVGVWYAHGGRSLAILDKSGATSFMADERLEPSSRAP
jgi:hypothetical protein